MAGYFRTVAERALRQSPVLHAALRPADPALSLSANVGDSAVATVGRDPRSLSTTESRADLIERDPTMRRATIPELTHAPETRTTVGEGSERRTREVVRPVAPPPEPSHEKVPEQTIVAVAQPNAPPMKQGALLPLNAGDMYVARTSTRMRAAGPRQNEMPADERRSSKDTDATVGKVARVPRDAQSPPDVHIHIGRIELTAVTTSPSVSKSPRNRTPMSLDEYLDRRSRKPR